MEKQPRKKTAGSRKLTLHRETLKQLEQAEVKIVLGGATANTCYRSCYTCLC